MTCDVCQVVEVGPSQLPHRVKHSLYADALKIANACIYRYLMWERRRVTESERERDRDRDRGSEREEGSERERGRERDGKCLIFVILTGLQGRLSFWWTALRWITTSSKSTPAYRYNAINVMNESVRQNDICWYHNVVLRIIHAVSHDAFTRHHLAMSFQPYQTLSDSLANCCILSYRNMQRGN